MENYQNMSSFPFHIQILIVSATMALHNFVRLNDRDDSVSYTPIEIQFLEENIIVKQVTVMSRT